MKKSIVLKCVCILISTHMFKEVYTLNFFGLDSLTIDLPQGRVRGSFDLFSTQRMFLGIPYATVTDRFQVAGSPPTWNGTFTANQGNVMCNQYFSTLRQPIGQEDCLVLNIYTPPSRTNELYPVIVFNHGGGFYFGSNSKLIYNPQFLVRENVIVITVNYRLGAFGFLCLGIKDAPGNVGLKDQLAALKWIQNNIAYFGGDPKSVTIFGESAGAVSVHYFLLRNSTEGLFHRVIMDSGSILMPQDFEYNPIQSASTVATRLGYNTSDPNELLQIFKNSTASDIVRASYADQTNDAFSLYYFTPCVETAVADETEPLITEEPTQIIKRPGLNVPVIIGFNNREGIYWAQHYNYQTVEQVRTNFGSLIPNYLKFESDVNRTTFINDAVNVYFSNRTVIDGLIEYLSDSLVIYPSTFASEVLTKNSNRSVYNFYFDYDSFRNLNKFLTRLRFTPGACHGDELFYLFQPAVYAALPATPNDSAIIAAMTALWTSFAKTGIPSTSATTWTPSNQQLKFLEIGKEIQMIPLPNQERMEFWRQTYEKYGRN
uniref:Carboxylic ester hydrolase n=1 Tax=Spodoptera frugiperda TaxID=7108 RepID=A0A2H1VCM0_SPOFR